MSGVPQLMKNPLMRGGDFGGVALAIYKRGCELFGWDDEKCSEFGRRQILYATDVTREGYSVWFLVHNSWTKTQGGSWHNEIFSDCIKEYWLQRVNDYGMFNDNTTRVTFAKNGQGDYVFLGIFVPVCLEQVDYNGKEVYVKTYKLVSNNYPEE